MAQNQKTYTLGPDGTLIPVQGQHHGMQQQQQYAYGGAYGQQQHGQQPYGYQQRGRQGGGMGNGVAAGLGAASCCLCCEGLDGCF